MEVHPYAWAFFVQFILVITFAVLNLFIAIVVNSMTNAAAAAQTETSNNDGGLPATPPTSSGRVWSAKTSMAFLRKSGFCGAKYAPYRVVD